MLESAEFWVAVAFVIFVALTIRPLLRAATGALDDRAERIREELAEAQRLREEAQAALADYKRRQRDAAKEAQAIIDRAHEEAKRLQAQAKDNLEQTLARRQQMAVDRIAQAEAAAVKEVREFAIDVAIATAGKLLEAQLAGEAGERLIDEAIEELPKKLH